jgi:pyruvate formate lyase activating enzyme
MITSDVLTKYGDIDGLVHSVETMGTVDGPGIRFVLFTSGCSLRCWYCHNPDTSYDRRGTRRKVSEILAEISQYKDFIKGSGGGVTISGGDPLFQPKLTKGILAGCKALGLHTCLDTSGHLGRQLDDEMLENTDLVLLDIKSFNPDVYKKLTGGDLQPTLDLARRLARAHKPVWLRYVLVPSITDNPSDIEALARYAAKLGNVERVDVLPFHQLGKHKWKELQINYVLEDTDEPSQELTETARNIFRANGFEDKVY